MTLPVVGLLGLLGLSACGGGNDAGAAPDLVIQPTVFVTVPPVAGPSTTVPLAEGEEVPDGTRNPAKQEYTVVAGDTLYGIASDFDVDIDDIVALNEWSSINQNLIPGVTVIQIPPNAIDAAVVERNRAGGDEAAPEDEEPGEDVLDMDTEVEEEGLCPNGDKQGTYTIAAGDIPSRVANRLDITVEQLTEANSGSNIMNTFIVGQELLLPCPDDED